MTIYLWFLMIVLGALTFSMAFVTGDTSLDRVDRLIAGSFTVALICAIHQLWSALP